MEDKDIQELSILLKEIRENQKLQLQKQSEALEIQQQHVQLIKRQFERAEKLQDRALNKFRIKALK